MDPWVTLPKLASDGKLCLIFLYKFAVLFDNSHNLVKYTFCIIFVVRISISTTNIDLKESLS